MRVISKLGLRGSWIVAFWSAIFGFLARLSLFDLLLRVGKGRLRTAGFVEFWVFLNSLLAIAALLYTSGTIDAPGSLFLGLIFGYAILRSFEVFVYQINVLLFDEYRCRKAGRPYAVHGYRRIVILLIHNYFELICWFGVIYIFFYRSGALAVGPGMPDPTFFSIFRDSLLLMFSFTAERYNPSNDLGLFLFSVHATVGIVMTVLVFARFLALLPTPASKDPLEEER